MKRTRPYPFDDDDDNKDQAADMCEKKRTCPSGNVDDNDRQAAHSTSPGLVRLSADGWRDVLPNLNFYESTVLRFASGALNRLIHRNSATLPRRVIAGLIVGFTEAEQRCWAHAFIEACSQSCWRDLVFEARVSQESLVLEVLSRCRRLAVGRLDLRDLNYDEQLVAVLVEGLQRLTVSEVFIDGVAAGHEHVPRLLQIIPGLCAASNTNNPAHPNAASFLGVCATRRIPNATLKFAADVTDTQIIDYLFSANSPRITRQFGICSLRRSVSENFFGTIVERCCQNTCRSLRFGMAGILTDPTDAKYERFVVERNDTAAMYKFRQADHAFTIVVGTSPRTGRFCLRVFQGDDNDLCTSLAAAKNIFTSRIGRPRNCCNQVNTFLSNHAVLADVKRWPAVWTTIDPLSGVETSGP